MSAAMNAPPSPDRAAAALALLSDLPFVSEPLRGIGGAIKASPDHFAVEEVLPYTPCGEGEHVYITFRRRGWNTADAARLIQKRLGLAPQDVGWGGRKDKTAVVVQTLSLRWGLNTPLGPLERGLAELPFEVLAVDRHRNKIKTGHVAANRFAIVVSDPVPDALPRAKAIARHLQQTGVPNFYGPQRFGHGMQNVHRGFALFSAGKKPRKDPFMVSVVQSVLFNIWLKERMQAGHLRRLLAGDVAKKTDTGGIFTVEDVASESQRFDSGAIVYTGPVYGFKMRPAEQTAGEIEASLLSRFYLTPASFRSLRAPGSRRPALLQLPDLDVGETDEGLRFTFTLPSGAYATTVMREFTRAA